MFRKTNPLNTFCLLIVCILLAAVTAFAQSQATTGNIEGRVIDANGAAIPGITVTATNPEPGLAKTAATDSEGLYRMTFLPPGKHRVPTGGKTSVALHH